MKQKFRLRPGYGSKEFLIEFRGDHRNNDFPDVSKILSEGLDSKQIKHPDFSQELISLNYVSTDQIISFWEYENGHYEINDDTWGLFIQAPSKNAQVMKDIERVLIESGLFEKEDVDYSEYEKKNTS